MFNLKLTSLALVLLIPLHTFAQPARVAFFTAKAWSAQLEPTTAVMVVRGLNDTFGARAATWRQTGHSVHSALPLAWGDYMDYLTGTWNGTTHFDEIQLRADGSEFERAGGGYYLVPSANLRDYLKTKLELAIDAGVEAVRLEQPFYWSQAGYSDGFKREYENFYQTPWSAPQANVLAQFQTEQLKFELELRAVSELLAHAKSHAQSKGRAVKGYVAATSCAQNALAGKVGPQAELLYVPECDGVIGQIAAEVRPTLYGGVALARPFESAWLDCGLFAQAQRGHDKELVLSFDLGNLSNWAARRNIFQSQVAAALFYPECARFEFQTAVEQLFRENNRSLALASAAGTTESIRAPANEAAVQTLILRHVMENMPQTSATLEAGERGIGVLMSDAITLQRVAPEASDSSLASFYGLALPLLKHGIPVQPLLLENLSRPGYLTGYKILFLSYRAFKPQRAKWHERLAVWVKTGGTLIFIDDDKDAFNQAPGWWRDSAQSYARPSEHLFQALGLSNGANLGRNKAGMGTLIYIAENPARYALHAAGPDSLLALLDAAMPHGRQAKRLDYLKIQRGPYVVATALAETPAAKALALAGDWIDLFDLTLPRVAHKEIAPGAVALLFDLTKRDSVRTQVVAASAQIAHEQRTAAQYIFTASAPAHAMTRIVLSMPHGEETVVASCAGNILPVQKRFENNLLWLEFEQPEQAVEIRTEASVAP